MNEVLEKKIEAVLMLPVVEAIAENISGFRPIGARFIDKTMTEFPAYDILHTSNYHPAYATALSLIGIYYVCKLATGAYREIKT